MQKRRNSIAIYIKSPRWINIFVFQLEPLKPLGLPEFVTSYDRDPYNIKFHTRNLRTSKQCVIFFHIEAGTKWLPFRRRQLRMHFLELKYTLGKKGCYTPIEGNKTNVDRTFLFPLGWNWHDMDPWLFPNEIRHYLGQTFNARSSGIVELRNHSIGGRSPKSIFTLWQLWINICIFFQKFFWLFGQCPVQPLWVLGMRFGPRMGSFPQ